MAELIEQMPTLLGAVVGVSLLTFTTEKFLKTDSIHSKSASLLDKVY
jgi:hypothetical protein